MNNLTISTSSSLRWRAYCFLSMCLAKSLFHTLERVKLHVLEWVKLRHSFVTENWGQLFPFAPSSIGMMPVITWEGTILSQHLNYFILIHSLLVISFMAGSLLCYHSLSLINIHFKSHLLETVLSLFRVGGQGLSIFCTYH